LAPRIREIPGVERVSLSAGAPATMSYSMNVYVSGRDSAVTLNGAGAAVIGADTAFFDVTGIAITSGRAFGAFDRAGTAPVAVVSESAARTLWPDETPLGKCVVLDKTTNPCHVIVGVAKDSHQFRVIEKPSIQVFVPVGQVPIVGPGPSQLLVRTSPERARSVAGILRMELKRATNAQAVSAIHLRDAFTKELEPWRLGVLLFTTFGCLALVVAAVGIYGVVSYGVAQRSHEVAVRLALGAQASDVLRLILSDGLRVLLWGVGLGLALALAFGGFASAMVYGISTRDPLTLVSVVFLVLATGWVACFVPARRAAGLDPAEALRMDR
jgi:putative ABC transport system permease protein